MADQLRKCAFATVTFLFTAMVFLNTYEVVFNRDIAFADSIQSMAAQRTINGVAKEFATKNLTDEINASAALDNMDHLEISSLSTRLHIEEARKIDDQWYARPDSLHSVELNKNQHGAGIDYLLYGVQSWRTVADPNRIEKGMDVEVYFAGGMALTFTVKDKKTLSIDQSLLVDTSDARQILIIIENAKQGIYYGYSLELKK